MNGPPSDGQQVMIGSRSRSGRSSTISWQAPFETVFGEASARLLSLPSARSLSAIPCGGCSSSTSASLAATSSSRSTPSARHMRRSLPNWLIRSGRREPLTLRKSSAGPSGLHHAIGDLGDLEVGIHLGVDLDELAFGAQQVEPLAQVVADHGAVSRYGHVAQFAPWPGCLAVEVHVTASGEQLGERRMLADEVLHARASRAARSSRAAGRAPPGCGSRTGSSRPPRSSSGPSCARAARARSRALPRRSRRARGRARRRGAGPPRPRARRPGRWPAGPESTPGAGAVVVERMPSTWTFSTSG